MKTGSGKQIIRIKNLQKTRNEAETLNRDIIQRFFSVSGQQNTIYKLDFDISFFSYN